MINESGKFCMHQQMVIPSDLQMHVADRDMFHYFLSSNGCIDGTNQTYASSGVI